LESTTAKHAFVTFLAGSSKSNDNTTDDSQDGYFVGARILIYQLLHAEDTRSRSNIPLIILVTPNVSERKRERMRQDGAIVVPVTTPVGSNVHPAIEGWKDVMAKLHLWELTQFELVAFLDADTILTRPIDGVFDDPATAIQTPLSRPDKVKSDEAPLPSTYLFAGVPELHKQHSSPPTLSPESKDYPNYYYLNAGFFVTKPSVELYDYYLSLVNLTDRYNPDLPEQNLLNYAHRRDEDGGNIPWRPLAAEWNVHYPSAADAQAGVASLHEKWWVPVPGLAEFFISLRWKMEGFWEGRQ
ncbi:glycosyltransferase family 8 protein, partial [Polychaeton citri CBS 116435]